MQDAGAHHLPPAEFKWTTDVVFGSDGDVVTLIDKDGETATLAVARVSNTVQLSLSAAGVVTIVNSAPTTLDISGYTLEAVTSGEVCGASPSAACGSLLLFVWLCAGVYSA